MGDPNKGAGQHEDYKVPGNGPFTQVSPEASYWAEESILRTVRIDEVVRRLKLDRREYPEAPTRQEIDEITTGKFGFDQSAKAFSKSDLKKLGVFLAHPAFIARPPTGTVLNNRIRTGRLPIVRNGAELATMFEAEKTAVWHQHVLLTLLDLPGEVKGKDGTKIVLRLREVISPIVQALMQAALHMTTLSALSMIWRFKWRATPDLNHELRIARRERPIEFFERQKTEYNKDYGFKVLFDTEIRFDADGNILRDFNCRPRQAPTSPAKWPGTPRHPAYGSGHSTYSKAASEILKVFLPDQWGISDMPGGMIKGIHRSLDLLADRIGEARFWGGVHWKLDHEFGQRVGKIVADLVVEQLNTSLVDPTPVVWVDPPPTRQDLEDDFARAKRERPWHWRKEGPPKLEAGDDGVAFQGGRVS